MIEDLDEADRFYATVSASASSPTLSFTMSYQGSATEAVVDAVVRNADAIATTLSRRLNA
jgi:hypothetical protein